MKRVSMILLGLLAVAAAADTSLVVDHEELLKEEQDQAAAEQADVVMQELQDTITGFLTLLEHQLWLPYVPLISVDTISLALTEVSLFASGGDLSFPKIPRKKVDVTLMLPTLTCYSGHYIAGGRLLDMPFVGESTANITLENLNMTFSVGLELSLPPCALVNSTEFTFTADNFFVKFADLNPGRWELGYLVNAVLESLGDDLLKWLSQELSPGGGLHETVDPFIVGLINNKPGCSSRHEETWTPEGLPELDVRGETVIGALQAVAEYLESVLGRVSIEEVFSRQIQTIMNAGVKQMEMQESGSW